MSLNEDVDMEEFITMKDDLSGADIKAVCTEAGLLALRERRMRVTKQDFTTAREKVRAPSPRAFSRFNLTHVCLGPIQEERGHSGGLVFVMPGLLVFLHRVLRINSVVIYIQCTT